MAQRTSGTSKATRSSGKKARSVTTHPRKPEDAASSESAVLEKIAAMPEPDRTLARRLHAVIRAAAPTLTPKLWYSMPGYARNGKIVCFFQTAQQFKTRYLTLGFMHEAHLDDGNMWPTAFAIKEMTPAEEAQITDLVKRA